MFWTVDNSVVGRIGRSLFGFRSRVLVVARFFGGLLGSNGAAHVLVSSFPFFLCGGSRGFHL